MRPSILLIGSSGQVGRELKLRLPRLGDLTSLSHQQLDLCKPEEIRGAIRTLRPALIVNAAAHTGVDKAESEEPLARAINAEAPAVMAQEAKRIGAGLVHYSTDYVFDGSKTAPYKEDDPTGPQNVYGRTKVEGENAIAESGVKHLIFRTSWVYADEGRNFLLTILRLATQREELKVVNDQFGAPTLNRAIAEATTEILERVSAEFSNSSSELSASGTYHMTAAGETTWFDFANGILEEAQAMKARNSWFAAATGNLPLITRRIIPIRTSEYPTPARRPPYSVLSNERLHRTFSVQLPDWRSQLKSVFGDPDGGPSEN